jgi:hypothetical protein
MQPGSFVPQMISARTTACGTARPSQPGRKCAHGRPVPPIRLAARPGPRPDCARGSRPKSEGARPSPARDARPGRGTAPAHPASVRGGGPPHRSNPRRRDRGLVIGSGTARRRRVPDGHPAARSHDVPDRQPDSVDGKDGDAVREPVAETPEEAKPSRSSPPRPPRSSPRLRRETVVCRRPAVRDRPRGDETTGSDETHRGGRAAGIGRPGSDGACGGLGARRGGAGLVRRAGRCRSRGRAERMSSRTRRPALAPRPRRPSDADEAPVASLGLGRLGPSSELRE